MFFSRFLLKFIVSVVESVRKRLKSRNAAKPGRASGFHPDSKDEIFTVDLQSPEL